MMTSTISPGETFWESPLGIKIDENIDSSNGDYVMETLDSPELLTIDWQWLD